MATKTKTSEASAPAPEGSVEQVFSEGLSRLELLLLHGKRRLRARKSVGMGREMALDVCRLKDANQGKHLARDVSTSEDADDTRHGCRSRGVDTLDLGVRLGTMQNRNVRDIGRVQIGGKLPIASQENRIFAALDGRAKNLSCHSSYPSP